METKFPNNLPPLWKEALYGLKEEPYFKKLGHFLNAEYQKNKIIFPHKSHILRALQTTDLDQVKVVILGQDPYHGDGQATGLSFAVPNELRLKPPSLQNIFKELTSDLKLTTPLTGSDLTGWADQGVLLLNTVLTVERNKAFSHRDKGWEIFTDKIISILGDRTKPLVFILWGSAAHKKSELIKPHHYILKSAHPSPLSAHRGFMGSKPFSKTNQLLVEKCKQDPIDWSYLTKNRGATSFKALEALS